MKGRATFRTRLLNILFWSVISAAFIGPGTVTTAAKAGADFGVPLLWALTFATLACLVLQEAASRLTIVSGFDLGQAIYHRTTVRGGRSSVPFMVAVCILSGTAAYQTGNLLGAMSGIRLLLGAPSWMLVLLLGLSAGLLLLVPSVKLIARILGGMVAIMGIAFLVSAFSVRPPLHETILGMVRPLIPPDSGGSLIVLGLIGTTVVPYNLFLGSGLSGGQSLKEMRSGLLVAVLLGGVISMAVLVTGTSLGGEFDRFLGRAGHLVLGLGLFAAGFTSAVTAPLASAVTVRSLFGNRDPGKWAEASLRFRTVWILVLLTGTGFGIAGFSPVPAIIVAQALNGLILPVMAIFLLVMVNDRDLMQGSPNRLPGNVLMTAIVYITLIIGLTGMTRAVCGGLKLEPAEWKLPLLVIGILAFVITGAVLLRIAGKSKRVQE